MRPAALTSASIRPKRARQSPTSRAGASGSARSAGDEAGGRAGRGEGRRHRLAAAGVAAGEEEAGGAAGGERLGDGAADALRRAGHERDLARRPEPPPSSPWYECFRFASMERGLPAVNRGARLPSPCVLGHGSAARLTRMEAREGRPEGGRWSMQPPEGRRPTGCGGDGRRRAERLHRRGPSLRHAARRPDRAGRRRAVGRPGERRRLGRRPRHRAGARLCRLARDGARRGGAAGRHRGGGDRHAEPPARADRDRLPRGRHRRDLRQAAVDDAGRGRGAGGADRGAEAAASSSPSTTPATRWCGRRARWWRRASSARWSPSTRAISRTG